MGTISTEEGERAWRLNKAVREALMDHYEEDFCRVVLSMLGDKDLCDAFEKRAVTLSTDFGDIRIVPNPFVAHDQLVVTHNDKPLAAVRINAPD